MNSGIGHGMVGEVLAATPSGSTKIYLALPVRQSMNISVTDIYREVAYLIFECVTWMVSGE